MYVFVTNQVNEVDTILTFCVSTVHNCIMQNQVYVHTVLKKILCFIVCINRYSGTLATLSRDVPFSLLFFPGYANLKVFETDFISNLYALYACIYVCMYGLTLQEEYIYV